MSTLQTHLVKKTAIIDSGDFNLSAGRYLKNEDIYTSSEFFDLSDLIEIKNGYAFKSKNYVDNGVRIIRIKNVQNGEIVDSDPKFYPLSSLDDFRDFQLSKNDLLMSLTGNVGRVGKIKKDLLPAFLNQRVCKLKPISNSLNNDYLFLILNNKLFEDLAIQNSSGSAQKNLSTNWIKKFKIPLPPLEIQKKIVKEIEGYQQIIDGCRQVVENYKPVIDIDPNWDMVELGEAYESNFNAKRIPITKSDRKKGDVPYYGASGIVDYVRDFIFDEELLLVSEDGANLKDRNFPIAFSISGKSWVNNHAHVLKFKSYENQKFIEFYLNNISLEPYITGSAQPKVNQRALNSIKVPNPSMEIQREIVEKLKQEIKVIEGNKELIQIYEKKINDKIKELF